MKEVELLEGILISNHMDKTEERRRFISPLIHSYGIKLFEWKDEKFGKKFETLAGKKKFFSFAFSDSHSPETVGKRKSYIPLKEVSFRSLREWFETGVNHARWLPL